MPFKTCAGCNNKVYAATKTCKCGSKNFIKKIKPSKEIEIVKEPF